MWHKMSLIGKLFIFISGFGLGMAFGFYKADPTIINEGNKVEMEYNGKTKKGSTVNLDISDINQNQHGNDTNIVDKKWWKRK